MPNLIALRILISGLVQGVGFRPYVHLTAKSLGLAGFVRNSGGSEVEIWAEGDERKLLEFLIRIALGVPEPAEVESIRIEVVKPAGYQDFTIEKSSGRVHLRSMIPPDFGICDECLKEVLDPGDRRYLYPLNSCVWCGPRYSMMYGVPYDRERTAMRDFPLCRECLAEYRDIGNRRRYHAQGISCSRCGPKVHLYTKDWEEVEVADPVAEAAKLINEGYIVGVKGVGGYHIACLASDDGVVVELRRRKRRPTKPFAVMAIDVEVAGRLVELSIEGARLLKSPQRPIVLLPKRESSPVSKYVSPGMSHEGVFLPYTALHYLLLSRLRDGFAVMTSGNVSDEPMCYDESCARGKLSRIADFFLVHERVIVSRVDDSVLRFTAGRPVLLRRGRGYAPRWIRIPARLESEVVALGADMHSAPAVAFEDKVVLTQYIGELVNGDTVSELLKHLSLLMKTYSIMSEDAVYVVDKHPRYVSRSIGIELGRASGRVEEVQHHVAHVLSTVADRGLTEERYIGVAVDGVGYGDDGAIWGCEVLYVNGAKYERVGRLSYVTITGSDRDIEYPARVLASYLLRLMDDEEIREFFRKRGLVKALPGGELELEVVLSRLRKGGTKSSSLGRLLDSISVLLGVTLWREFEGSPAIALEEAALGGRLLTRVEQPLVRVGEVVEVDPIPLLRSLVELLDTLQTKDLAYSAQYYIGRALGRAIAYSARGRRVSRLIPAGGGAAVNDVVIRGVMDELSPEGLEVVLPREVPPNDGGIALGQVYWAALREQFGGVR